MTRFASLALVCLVACGDDGAGIDSNEEARRAYLGLDASIEASLGLGFAGFNAADSANIPPQTGSGLVGGTLVISGKVDQGSSDNKGMRLSVGMTGYTDGHPVVGGEMLDIDITYDTNADVTMQPALTLALKNIPTGTLTGTLVGSYTMHGDIDGDVVLNLAFAGMLQPGPGDSVIRVPGSTAVTGTATAGDGVFQVDLSL